MLTKKSGWVIAIIILSWLVLLWFFSVFFMGKNNPPIINGNNMIEDQKKNKSVCIGRYIIDLPESFYSMTGVKSLDNDLWVADISWEDGKYKAYVTTKRMFYPAFERYIKDREVALMKTQTINPTNMPFLKKTRSLPDGVKGVIFERNLDVSADDSSRTIEAYLFSNGVAIKIQKETLDYSSEKYKVEQAALGQIINDVPEDLELINELILRIKGRSDDEILSGAGTCIVNAFIKEGHRKNEKESASVIFKSEDLPGFTFSVRTNNFLREQRSLLERVDDIDKYLSDSNATIIKKHKRSSNGLDSESIVIMGRGFDGENPRYVFELYINERSGSNNQPWLNVSLTNESNYKIPHSGLTKDELMLFWDDLTQSIRYRIN